MNIELTKRALEKIGNQHILVNVISRRVRQLNSGSGGSSRPLVEVTPGMGAADIALLEVIEDKIGYELIVEETAVPEVAPAPRKRAKRAPAAAAPAPAAAA